MKSSTIQSSENANFHPAAKVCLLLSLLLAAFMFMLLLFFPYGRDQGIYAVVGRTILEGGAPYKDAWDFKPPGIFFIYAFARILFGASQHAIRILEVLNLFALTWAFAVYSRRHFTSLWPGICAGCLAVINHVQMGFWDTAQPESFGATVLSWALVFATYQSKNENKNSLLKQILSWIFSGAFFTAAALLKPPLGGGILVSITVIAILQTRSITSGKKLNKILALIISFGLGVFFLLILIFIYFAHKGALKDIYDTFFIFVPGYTGLKFSLQSMPVLLGVSVKRWLLSFSIFTSIGMVFCFLLPRCHAREFEGCVHVLGVIFFQIIGVAMQAKFFSYHYGAILPFSALLAVWGYAKLWNKVKLKWILLLGFMIALSWQIYEKNIFRHSALQIRALASNGLREIINDGLYTIYDQNSYANRKTAEWLYQNTPPGEPIFIWGFEPAIYDMANRPSSSRYIYNIPQRVDWGKKDAQQILLKELVISPPAAIVIVHNDPLPKVTGNQLDSAKELENFTRLLDFIEKDYSYVKSYEDLDIYIRIEKREVF
jgi:hypothetical protein